MKERSPASESAKKLAAATRKVAGLCRDDILSESGSIPSSEDRDQFWEQGAQQHETPYGNTIRLLHRKLKTAAQKRKNLDPLKIQQLNLPFETVADDFTNVLLTDILLARSISDTEELEITPSAITKDGEAMFKEIGIPPESKHQVQLEQVIHSILIGELSLDRPQQPSS